MANLVIKPTFLSIIAEEKSSKSAPEVHVSTLKEGVTLEELIIGESSDEKPDFYFVSWLSRKKYYQ